MKNALLCLAAVGFGCAAVLLVSRAMRSSIAPQDHGPRSIKTDRARSPEPDIHSEDSWRRLSEYVRAKDYAGAERTLRLMTEKGPVAPPRILDLIVEEGLQSDPRMLAIVAGFADPAALFRLSMESVLSLKLHALGYEGIGHNVRRLADHYRKPLFRDHIHVFDALLVNAVKQANADGKALLATLAMSVMSDSWRTILKAALRESNDPYLQRALLDIMMSTFPDHSIPTLIGFYVDPELAGCRRVCGECLLKSMGVEDGLTFLLTAAASTGDTSTAFQVSDLVLKSLHDRPEILASVLKAWDRGLPELAKMSLLVGLGGLPEGEHIGEFLLRVASDAKEPSALVRGTAICSMSRRNGVQDSETVQIAQEVFASAKTDYGAMGFVFRNNVIAALENVWQRSPHAVQPIFRRILLLDGEDCFVLIRLLGALKNLQAVALFEREIDLLTKHPDERVREAAKKARTTE